MYNIKNKKILIIACLMAWLFIHPSAIAHYNDDAINIDIETNSNVLSLRKQSTVSIIVESLYDTEKTIHLSIQLGPGMAVNKRNLRQATVSHKISGNKEISMTLDLDAEEITTIDIPIRFNRSLEAHTGINVQASINGNNSETAVTKTLYISRTSDDRHVEVYRPGTSIVIPSNIATEAPQGAGQTPMHFLQKKRTQIFTVDLNHPSEVAGHVDLTPKPYTNSPYGPLDSTFTGDNQPQLMDE